MHASTAAVCTAFRDHLNGQEFKILRRAAGFEEQFFVAAGGYGGNSCAAPCCTVRSMTGWSRLPDLPRHVDFGCEGTEGVCESAAV
eukprot:2004909-Prymnesium_polylepis.2